MADKKLEIVDADIIEKEPIKARISNKFTAAKAWTGQHKEALIVGGIAAPVIAFLARQSLKGLPGALDAEEDLFEDEQDDFDSTVDDDTNPVTDTDIESV